MDFPAVNLLSANIEMYGQLVYEESKKYELARL